MSATLTPKARGIVDQAMELSSTEREAIALRLLESIEPPPNSYDSPEALRAELQRRWEAIQNGTEKTYSIEETMAYLRKRLADGETK